MRPYRFYLRPEQSPTYYNLCHYLNLRGWKSTRFSGWSHFGEKQFQFDASAAECLEFKHLLAQLVASCEPPIMPVTYCLNDHNWALVLSQIADKYYRQENQLLDQKANLVWILKPALLNNGQHIQIFQKLSQIEQHFLSAKRLGGEHVLQQYLIQPHLLKGPQKGHKYSIRMFVVLNSQTGAYLYPKGYFNVGLHPFDPGEFTDIRPHLTNEHLREDELNVVQIPTDQYELFKPFYPQIKTIVSTVIGGLQQQYPQAFSDKKPPALAIFGFDFMVDSEQRVWLLEANHAPCFPVNEDHPLQKSLYADFWQAVISQFVIPMGTGSLMDVSEASRFELVTDVGG